MSSLLSIRHRLASAREQLASLDRLELPEFEARLTEAGTEPLETGEIEVLQVNVGKLCNQTCGHCHVDAGPDRTEENMTRETAEQVIELLRRHPIPTLDITGGAPELNPNFRWMVQQARAMGRHVIDRCNLTILLVRSQSDLIEFLTENNVEVIASLPSFRKTGTDAQRGDGVFDKSIEALRRLNEAGYGREDSELVLSLVHNPVGAFLPGNQASLERDYKRELAARHGIVFNNLYTITNMPVSRYLEWLQRTGNLTSYMSTLVNSFNPAAVQSVMCRSYISVGWDGILYDCDFNQMLELPVDHGAPNTLAALLRSGDLRRTVVTGRHCYGCTAGAGSSCAGTVAE